MPTSDIALHRPTERDLPGVAEMWRRCGRATRAARFHGAAPLIPTDHLAAVVADPSGSLVAVHRPTGTVIALASLLRNHDGVTADLGVLVEDSWQRCGIAPLLVEPLIRAAPARGISTVTAEIFSEHAHVGRLLRRIPGEFSSVHHGATSAVAVRLAHLSTRLG
ncbi:GNAT family N-acetyltransferase [Pseudonocardia spinosispora]|uniref:GNAT family N-acetyltransferase n=1 Tax=Pseudonocardia spinosispora TaxID=103441 RepID=UPI0003FEA66E|nr:GNAT family N-acetyltransferase [Pseudonocardia spinosispora]